MVPPKSYYACQSCGHQSAKWLGRCPECGTWNSLVEETALAPRRQGWEGLPSAAKAQPLVKVEQAKKSAIQIGISELDRALGGGIVPGGVTLVGGDPGIGKSTLLLQALAGLSKREGIIALYVSGEESVTQTKLRADRLGLSPANLYVLAETNLEAIFAQVDKVKPKAMVIDSVQTIYSSALDSPPGSISQVRETAARIIQLAKLATISTFLIGHVTKDGSLAGPRALEHLVDTVLYFEGEPGSSYRILRVAKNRFGPTDEIGVFEMGEAGLVCVADPSLLFLSERAANVPGSAVVPVLKGTRPVLVEIQALASSAAFGVPRRTALGVDANRVSMIMAVLDRRVGLNLAGTDLFVNVAGGVRIDEPAADLGIAAALASSLRNKPVEGGTVTFGEVGLTGEIRAIRRAELRIREAMKLGFTRCVLPVANEKEVRKLSDAQLVGARTLAQALEICLA